jgi:hypothetical protein
MSDSRDLGETAASSASQVNDDKKGTANVTISSAEHSEDAVYLTPDEEILAKLGYKQEFKRAFSAFEVFGIAFSIIGLFPSIASVLVYAIPYASISIPQTKRMKNRSRTLIWIRVDPS